jgi:hypothetical protein
MILFLSIGASRLDNTARFVAQLGKKPCASRPTQRGECDKEAGREGSTTTVAPKEKVCELVTRDESPHQGSGAQRPRVASTPCCQFI